MKILVTDSLAPQGLEVLRRAAGFEVDLRLGLKPEETKKVVGPYHGWVIRSGTKITADMIEAADNLKVIGRAGIGVDNVDVEAASRKGIVVMNTPGGNNVTTAEHTISLMLALARHIPQAVASLKAGEWKRDKFMGVELCNKTLGIIGLGNVGRIVAERALGLRMKVIGHDPFVQAEAAARMGVELVSLDEIFGRSDFITVHVPLTNETRGLIDRSAIAKMKTGVRIINCARGGIVDENDLADALRREARKLDENGIRLRIIGDRSRFHPELQAAMSEVEEMTAANHRFVLQVAANYGGQWDILQAAQHLATEAQAGRPTAHGLHLRITRPALLAKAPPAGADSVWVPSGRDGPRGRRPLDRGHQMSVSQTNRGA